MTTFTIMITTHNRREDLRRTCTMLARLDPAPDEVLVCADGCDDGTLEMLRSQFPTVAVIENEQRIGSVGARDRMLRLARGDIVVSLDDDSYPIETDFVDRLGSVLAAHPEAAVVSFAVLHDDRSYASPNETPTSPGRYVPAYANCGAAMRRSVYLAAPGFPAFFEHGYEEADYALQCYGRGWAVWFEPSLVVRHHMSPTGRDHRRRQHLHARNELWSVLLRCPWPYLPVVALYRLWRQLRHAATLGIGDVLAQPLWWWSGLRGLPACLRERRPIPWSIYWRWMQLARQPLLRRSDLSAVFGTRPAPS